MGVLGPGLCLMRHRRYAFEEARQAQPVHAYVQVPNWDRSCKRANTGAQLGQILQTREHTFAHIIHAAVCAIALSLPCSSTREHTFAACRVFLPSSLHVHACIELFQIAIVFSSIVFSQFFTFRSKGMHQSSFSLRIRLLSAK